MSTATPINRERMLPEPLCKPFPHFIKWTRNTLVTLVLAGLFAYIGMLIIVALYYLLFEVSPTMNNWWHSTVPNSDIRHTIRNVGEGLLGGLLAQQIIWNHYKKKVARRRTAKKNLLDRIEIALHIPNVKDGRPFSGWQLAVTPLLVCIYALPGGVVGFLIVHWVHRHNLHALTGVVTQAHPVHSSIATKMGQTFTQAWPTKLVGYGSAFFFGRRPARGVFDDVQLLFAQRRLANGQGVRWYQPPTFRARYNELKASAPEGVHAANFGRQSKWVKWVIAFIIPISLGLAVFGWYVLSYIAK